MTIQLAEILTTEELRVNINQVRLLMLNREMVLTDQDRKIDDIRVRWGHVEIKTPIDRDWRETRLSEIAVQ